MFLGAQKNRLNKTVLLSIQLMGKKYLQFYAQTLCLCKQVGNCGQEMSKSHSTTLHEISIAHIN